MHSNLFMYLTAMSAVSLHNLVNNINEATRGLDNVRLKTIETDWNFGENLGNIFPECNGTRQSPVNIDTTRVRDNLNLRLGLTAYDKPISGFLVNKFPGFQLVPLSFRWTKPNAIVSSTLARSFNPAREKHYTLNHVQFFWSTNDERNSSIHTLDNENFPAEIHFVHNNIAYQDIDEALSKPDGLLIFAIMVIPSTHESYIFDRLLEDQVNITHPGQQILIEEDSTWRSLLPADTSKFYRYQGSTIFPPCEESVQWILFDEKLKLGHRQLKRLRQHSYYGRDMRNGKEINWSAQRRPIQQLNNRMIERSFNGRLGIERSRFSKT